MDTSEIYQKMCNCHEIQDEWNHQESYGDWVSFRSESHEKEVDVGEKTKLKIEKNSPYHVVWNSPIHGIESLNGATFDVVACIWLPRQDQIQGIVRENYAQEMNSKRPRDKWFPGGDVGLLFVFERFHEFFCENMLLFEKCNSFEQLWLTFYMWKKHEVTWNGEKWCRNDN